MSDPAGEAGERSRTAWEKRRSEKDRSRERIKTVLRRCGVVEEGTPLPSKVADRLLQLVWDHQAQEHFESLRSIVDSGAVAPTLETIDDLLARPEPVFLVEGFIPGIGVVQLSGPAGSYKSFIAQDLGLTIASGGTSWAGFPVSSTGDVVYVAMEGGFDLALRVKAWLSFHPSGDKPRFFARVEHPLDLGNRHSVDQLIRLVKSHTSDPRLLVIDTQGLAIPGRSEDSATEMNLVFGQCKRISTTLECCVMLVHHTGWDDGRERGSSAQRQAVDTSILVKDRNHLSVQKIKAAADPEPRYFRMVEHAGSLVVEWVTDPVKIHLLAAGPSEEEDDQIVDFVRLHPGLTKSSVASALGGNKRKRLLQIEALIISGRLKNDGSSTKYALVVGDHE